MYSAFWNLCAQYLYVQTLEYRFEAFSHYTSNGEQVRALTHHCVRLYLLTRRVFFAWQLDLLLFHANLPVRGEKLFPIELNRLWCFVAPQRNSTDKVFRRTEGATVHFFCSSSAEKQTFPGLGTATDCAVYLVTAFIGCFLSMLNTFYARVTKWVVSHFVFFFLSQIWIAYFSSGGRDKLCKECIQNLPAKQFLLPLLNVRYWKKKR